MTAAPLPAWLRAEGGTVTIALAVQPGAKTTGVVGPHGDALKVRVASPPIDGAATEALLAFLAEALGVKRRDVELMRGATSRQKLVRIAGVEPAQVMIRLASAARL